MKIVLTKEPVSRSGPLACGSGPLKLRRRFISLIAMFGIFTGCRGGPLNSLGARLELKKGNESYLAGRYEDAVKHYDQALLRNPTLSKAYLNRAYSQVALFRLNRDMAGRAALALAAVGSFEKYLSFRDAPGGRTDSKSPGRDRVEEHILTLYLDSGQVGKAEAFLQARLERNPKDLPTLQMLSNIAADHGDLEGALRWLRRRIEVNPGEPGSHYALGVFAWRVSYYNMTTDPLVRSRILDEGVRELLKSVELNPAYFEAHSHMNLIYRQKAQYAEDDSARGEYEALARQYRDRAMKLRPAARESGAPDSVHSAADLKR